MCAAEGDRLFDCVGLIFSARLETHGAHKLTDKRTQHIPRCDRICAAAVVITGKALERLSEAGVKLRLIDYRQDRSAAEHEVAVIGQLGRREYTDDRAAVRSAYILMLDKRKGNENLSNRQLIAFFADNDLGISACQI